MKKLTFTLLFLLALSANAIIIPTANQGNWTAGAGVGVDGGMLQYIAGGVNDRAVTGVVRNVTLPPYSVNNTGVGDVSAQVQLAVDASNPGDVVYFPAGTYRFTSSIFIEQGDSGITIRGAGPNATTFIVATGSTLFSFAGYNGGSDVRQTVTGTKTKGTTVLSVASSANFAVGDFGFVAVENEENNARIQAGAAPTWSNSGFRELRTVPVRIMAVAAGQVTVDPGLPWDCTPYAVVVGHEFFPNNTTGVGFEDLNISFEGNAAYNAFTLRKAIGCWIYNVKADNWTKNTGSGQVIDMNKVYKCEVRKFRAVVPSPNTAGDDGAIQIYDASSCLLIDNILVGWDYGIYEFGKTYNSVFAYNYVDTGADSLFHHNSHTSLVLEEGNIMTVGKSDGYHGSASHNTLFRNWIMQRTLGTTLLYGLVLNRFVRNTAIVGNVVGENGRVSGLMVFGNPNIGNGDFTGTAQPTLGDFWVDWLATGVLTTRTSDASGVVTMSSGGDLTNPGLRIISLWWSGYAAGRIQMNLDSKTATTLTVSGGFSSILPAAGTPVTVYFFAEGYQEKDLDVAATSTQTENYIASASGTGSIVNPTAEVLPNSLVYASKPSWLGNLPWPTVDPDNPTFNFAGNAAGYRFINGVDPPPGGPDTTPPTVSSATIQAAGNQLVVAFSEPVNFGAGGSGGWTISLSGGSATVTYATGAGSSGITFNLSRAVNAGETGTVTYVQPGNGWRDLAPTPNQLAGVSVPVINNSAGGPTLNSATINPAGNQLSLVFSQNVQAGTGGNGGWTITPSGGAAGLTFNTGVGSNTLIYDIVGRTINIGETATLNYTQPGNGIESAVSGLDVVSISNRPVTNNSTQTQATVATPVITLAAGPYFGTQSTTITIATAGAAIHYTTDGTTPTIASPTYSTPISIASNMTIRAIGTKSGVSDSPVATSAYEVVSWLITPAMVTKTFTIPALASSLPWIFTVTPAAAPCNTVISLGPGPVSTPADWSIAINLGPSGVIQARNGATFTATQVVNYTAAPVVIRVDINWAAKTFSATANNITFATNYAFSSGQPTPVSLGNVGLFTAISNATISAMSFPTGPASARYIGLRGVPAAGGATP